jgi:hypothetical protein
VSIGVSKFHVGKLENGDDIKGSCFKGSCLHLVEGRNLEKRALIPPFNLNGAKSSAGVVK